MSSTSANAASAAKGADKANDKGTDKGAAPASTAKANAASAGKPADKANTASTPKANDKATTASAGKSVDKATDKATDKANDKEDNATSSNSSSSSDAAAGAVSVASAMASMKHIGVKQWITIGLFIVTIALLGTNVGIVSKMAGSKDDWDTLKPQLSGSVAICFIGAAVFAVALYLFVSQFDLGNMMIPIVISILVSCVGLAVGLSGLSVAAITR